MRSSTYQLRMRLEIQEVDEHGERLSAGLGVDQHADLGPMEFLEVAQVLGRFHELATTIENEKAKARQNA
jgi:hypothetical protein